MPRSDVHQSSLCRLFYSHRMFTHISVDRQGAERPHKQDHTEEFIHAERNFCRVRNEYAHYMCQMFNNAKMPLD